MSFRRSWVLALAAVLSGCPHRPSGATTTLTIDTPAIGASFGSGSSFSFHATGTNSLGLASITLSGGGDDGGPALTQLASCSAPDPAWGTPSNAATCAFTFRVSDHTSLLSGGTLLLTATALDRANGTTIRTITLNVSALGCSFLIPGTDSSVANVSGASTSPIIVQITNDTSPLQSIVVTSDDGRKEISWPGSGTLDAGTLPGEWDLRGAVETWPSEVGVGMHQLSAVCTDRAGDVVSCTLDVNVGCASDSDCPSGDRCCSEDGQCFPIVAEGADCDCQHPCPADEGCFPGICDAAPQKCRPGCFPGSDSPPPYGTPAAICAPQDGVPAFCNNLPADQVTQQNMGGACAVGDNCSPITQNCPDLPLNRPQPATLIDGGVCTTLSPSCPNPTVPQDCVPFAPGVNGCIPAGTIPICGTGCNQTCGQTSGNCEKGGFCTQAVDSNGNPLGPPTCSPQNDPHDAGCP